MNAFDPVAALRKQVDAAKQEFHMALSFYETWKPAAYDKACRSEWVCRSARKHSLSCAWRPEEMLLALMPLWDKDSKAVRMKEESIADVLRDQSGARKRPPLRP